MVQSGDESKLLNIESLKLNGSSIKDFAGNDANLYLQPGILQSNNEIIVDTSAPLISDIDSNNQSGYYKAGDTIVIEVKFNEVIRVTGVPGICK